jgi:hypothetical protein
MQIHLQAGEGIRTATLSAASEFVNAIAEIILPGTTIVAQGLAKMRVAHQWIDVCGTATRV